MTYKCSPAGFYELPNDELVALWGATMDHLKANAAKEE